MPAIWTNAGLAAFANSHLTGAPVDITELRIGQQGVGYDPSPTQVALLNDAAPVVFPISDMNLTSSGPRVSYDLMLERAGVLTAQEVGFFAGATLVAIWSEVGRPVFVKDAAATAVLAFIYEYQQGVPTSLDIAVTAFQFVFATPQEAAAAMGDASTEKVMSPRRVWDWWTALTEIAAQKISGILSSDTLPDATTNAKGALEVATVEEARNRRTGGRAITTTNNPLPISDDDDDYAKIVRRVSNGPGYELVVLNAVNKELNFQRIFYGTTEDPPQAIRQQMTNLDIYLQYKAAE